jgi:peptide deformylase
MILPIVAYGDPILRKVADDIDKDYPDLAKLIENMFETMYSANGVGLAAPQIGKAIRMFLVDASSFAEPDDDGEVDEEMAHLADFKRVFINVEVLEETGEEWAFAEGCLSIPGFREDVYRPEKVTVRYLDENFEQHEETFHGIAARVIQHEYDHIDGILFTDHLSPLRKRLLKRRLTEISKGIVDVDYKMRFPSVKKGR